MAETANFNFYTLENGDLRIDGEMIGQMNYLAACHAFDVTCIKKEVKGHKIAGREVGLPMIHLHKQVYQTVFTVPADYVERVLPDLNNVFPTFDEDEYVQPQQTAERDIYGEFQEAVHETHDDDIIKDFGAITIDARPSRKKISAGQESSVEDE